MANGFEAIRVQGTSGTCGIIETYFFDSTSTAAAIGDVVVSVANDNTQASGLPAVTLAAGTGVAILGVIVGFTVDPENLLRTGRAASTDAVVQVAIDPLQVFKVEVATGIIEPRDLNSNAATDITAPSISGNFIISQMSITAAAVTAALPWRIVGADADTFDTDTGSFTTVYVRPNQTSYKAGVLGLVGA